MSNSNIADLSVFESLQENANAQMGMLSGMAVFNAKFEKIPNFTRKLTDDEKKKVKELKDKIRKIDSDSVRTVNGHLKRQGEVQKKILDYEKQIRAAGEERTKVQIRSREQANSLIKELKGLGFETELAINEDSNYS